MVYSSQDRQAETSVADDAQPIASTSRITAHLSKFAYVPGPSTSPNKGIASPRSSPRSAKKRSRDEVKEEDEAGDVECRDMKPSPSKRRMKDPAAMAAISPTPSPARKIPRPYAPPETYAHLNGIGDHLAPDLRVIFCGINPGKMSATLGAHYANPSNRFWKMLHFGGFTPDRIYKPSEDKHMPRLYSLGLTNLVDRVTSEQSELSGLEMRMAMPAFLVKLERWQPLAVVMVGKKIWDEVETVLKRSLGKLDEPRISKGKPTEALVKMEEVDEPVTTAAQGPPEPHQAMSLEEEPDEKLQSESPAAKGKVRFMWESPRPYKLVHRKASSGQSEKATLFWVVPSTSGLERTLMPERIAYAASINAQIRDLEAGSVDLTPYHPIDMAGIQGVVDEMARKAALAQSKKDNR